jgi:hypothetical protein
MNGRRFPPPWSVEEPEACFVVRDHSGQTLNNGPERTSSYFQRAFDPLQCLVLSLGKGDETALQSKPQND